MNSCVIKIPVTFILITHTWVQALLKFVRNLLLGHTMSSSPGCMLRQQWNRMLSLYCTASRFVSSRLRAQLMYLREERDRGQNIRWNDRDFRCTILLTMEMDYIVCRWCTRMVLVTQSTDFDKKEEHMEWYLIQFEWDSLAASMYSYSSFPL